MPRQLKYEPFGKNGLPADYMFFQRNYYKIDPAIYSSRYEAIDIWYDKPLFGKIDTTEKYVYPLESRLKLLKGDLYAMNFVADAYHDMAQFVITATKAIRTSMSSIVDVTDPTKAYENIDELYRTYWDGTIKVVFINEYLTKKRRNKIKNFKDFLNYYIEFAKENKTFPITQASYLASNRTSPRISGLIIEFGDDPYDDDNLKWQKYLSSDFFPQYARIMNGFGFFIDKNIPWRIVSNLNSHTTKDYMANYDVVDAEDNFIQNYLLCEYFSFETFKNYLWFAYLLFVDFQPTIQLTCISNKINKTTMDSSYKTGLAVHPRHVELMKRTYEEFETSPEYTESYLLERYLQIRLAEEDLKLKKREYSFIVKKMKSTLKELDAYDAVGYLARALYAQKKKKQNR